MRDVYRNTPLPQRLVHRFAEARPVIDEQDAGGIGQAFAIPEFLFRIFEKRAIGFGFDKKI
ncbi:hypothetical protein [uncultured Variovorax sp.]|uniref:hypothetical protein n=1 Tax=uncultured Variovorax sp. TaxID=114708 RepID=UPI0025FA9D38|nr:hypothetical protein [uncultured Variovorax sp.]